MEDDYSYGLYEVVAAEHRQAELWVAAVAPINAIPEILRRLPPGCMVTFTGESLTHKEAEVLNIRQSEVRKLRAA